MKSKNDSWDKSASSELGSFPYHDTGYISGRFLSQGGGSDWDYWALFLWFGTQVFRYTKAVTREQAMLRAGVG